ncbi:hypothetical protein BDV28DRAFT_135752 [Aspergillus coremiiformis]|uniref:Uncharacterized protein n=1 Tax=Aspergillus coremiiformis TaxID=138285 RepID=A0A5N6Z3U9_9EURO|nr:hypothetical protein BDV28DRAFT_135752 [Aspergillus coremiiformis]
MFARSFAFRQFSPQYPKGSWTRGLAASSPTWRYFTSSAARTKAAIKVKPQYKPPQPKSSPQTEHSLKFAGQRAEGFGKLERKVAKEGQVLLFQALSHRSYVLGAYSITAFCFAYAVYNSNVVFRDPVVTVPTWQKALFAGVCTAMSAMGTVFIFKTARLIKTIKAVQTGGHTYLRFTVRSIIPFRKPYVFDALPRQIAFSRRLVVAQDSVARKQQSGTLSFFKTPLRKTNFFFWRIFRSVRQLFTQEDFILLEVEGHKGDLRLDSAGFVSKDFFVIGNPVSVKR